MRNIWIFRHIRLAICFAYFILLFCSSILCQTIAAIPIESSPSIQPDISVYHPEIEYVGRDPLHTSNDLPSPPNSDVPVFAKVIDKYGKIQQAVLSYWTGHPFFTAFSTKQEHPPRNNITMKLLNGTPSNGIYSAIIPEQMGNTLVHYQIYLKDDLNIVFRTWNGKVCI